MRKFLYLLYLATLSSFSQSNSFIEQEIYTKANQYLRALKENNRHEFPSADERRSIIHRDDVTSYATEKAYENFKLLITDFPLSEKLPIYYYELGYLEYQMNSFEKSKINLNKVIEINNSENSEFYRNAKIVLAKISIDENKFEEALVHLNEIEKNIPKNTPRCGNELFSKRNELKPLYEAIAMGIK